MIRNLTNFSLQVNFSVLNWMLSFPISLSIPYSFGKSMVYILELSQKSDFQPSTTKLDNIGHPTVETNQI